MEVSKELIEKYHSGKCSPEESAMVENWLLDDDSEFETALPENLNKEKVKAEMWDEISSSLPSANHKIVNSRQGWLYFAAAASIVILLTVSIFEFKPHNKKAVLSSANIPVSTNKEIHSSDYTISLAPESNASINSESGLIDFCGAILISPKKDILLSFNDVCDNTKSNTGKMNFKKGETYIALNFGNKKDNELIVMDEKLLMGLPPMVKRQIMDQFNI
ncbi:hypothetical protein SAMN04487995_3916 [Dyadobacter koreensis]|uniref:FecR family protein n=1 Tax=Dyadobacter koreensis TaxID=408657 RepID=A0A1H6XHW7_9BACT|nr:hypothetical protein [Dyadobacter koreensis]SEJ27716.1 hypothetical protein SAMN04487995_3916 [Dyadobacter koreensis]